MKNLIFTCLLIFFGCLNSFSQPTISTAPATSLICPGALTDYSISYPSGYTSCSVVWSISTGTGIFFNGNQTSSNVKVTWDDQKPNKVTIQAVVTYFGSGGACASSEKKQMHERS